MLAELLTAVTWDELCDWCSWQGCEAGSKPLSEMAAEIMLIWLKKNKCQANMIKKQINQGTRSNSIYSSPNKYTLLKTRLPTLLGWPQQKCCGIFKPQLVNPFSPSNKYGIHRAKPQKTICAQIHLTATGTCKQRLTIQHSSKLRLRVWLRNPKVKCLLSSSLFFLPKWIFIPLIETCD